MDNNTFSLSGLPPAVLKTMSQYLLKHWETQNAQRKAGLIDVAQPPNNAAMLAMLATPNLPHSLIDSSSHHTPPVQRADSGLSCSSATSSSSSRSRVKDVDFEDYDDDESWSIKKRRCRASDQDKDDADVVRRPVLRLLDSKYLAPHPNVENKLFKKRFKVTTDSEGTRTLKKYKDLVMREFRQLVRHVIRRLTSRHLPRLQEKDPNLTYDELRRRYFLAALKITKKRRANHVQNWRINKCHKPKIYENVLQFDRDPPARPTISDEPPAPRRIYTVPPPISDEPLPVLVFPIIIY